MISSNWIEKEEWLPEFTDHTLTNDQGSGSNNMLYNQVVTTTTTSPINSNHHHYDNVHILSPNNNNNNSSPADSFDPDLDEVDEKFIDSLLNNTLQSTTTTTTNSNNHFTGNHQYNGGTTQFVDFPDIFPTAPLGCTAAAPLAAPPSIIHPLEPECCATVTHLVEDKAPKKSTPQFRWRRRKRRSKAQYPEMSRYLLPIDSGDEVQHLGRTLECTLCGLRGKRCHLTLHFKAKHSEVIEFNNSNGNGIAKSSNNNSKSNTTNGAIDDGNHRLEENNGANKWIKNGYKILDLEEALGKAFLFIKDTLSDDDKVSAIDSVSPAASTAVDRQNNIENACMKKISNN